MKYILSLLLICSLSANSTIYYVRTDGSNANTGTSNTAGGAWLTVAYAAAHTTSGDDIFVQPGTYTETSQVALPVGVDLYGTDSATCIIKSTLTATFTSAIYLASAEGTNGNQSIHDLKFDGDMTCQMGIIVSGRSNVSIYNCRFYDFFDVGIIFRGRTDFADGPPTTYSTGNTFHDNYVWNCANIDASYGRGCLEIGGQIGILVYNDTIIQTARATGDNGYCMKNVNQGWIKGMKVYNCYLEVNPFHCSSAGGCDNRWDFAFEFSDNQGLEFYNNRVLGSCDQNFQYKGDYPYSVYYHDNIFGWPSLNTYPSWGIILEYSTSDAKIQNNTFMNIMIPFWFVPRSGDTLHRDTITNNLAYGMGTISSYDGRAIKQQGDYSNNPANGWVIDNNTFIGKTGGQGTFGIDIPLGSTAGVSNNKCRNNIVTNFSVAIHSGGGGNMSNIYINNNLTDNVTTVISLGGTPTGTYSTTGNISAAPDLNSTTYAPNVGSPAINAGTDGTDIGYTGGNGDYPPVVNTVTPTNGATGQLITIHPTATFSEALDGATVNTTNVTMTQGGSPVTITVGYSSLVITVTPSSSLSYSTTYTVTYGVGITDAGGNPMASPQSFTFTTESSTPPPPPSGGGFIIRTNRRIRFQ